MPFCNSVLFRSLFMSFDFSLNCNQSLEKLVLSWWKKSLTLINQVRFSLSIIEEHYSHSYFVNACMFKCFTSQIWVWECSSLPWECYNFTFQSVWIVQKGHRVNSPMLEQHQYAATKLTLHPLFSESNVLQDMMHVNTVSPVRWSESHTSLLQFGPCFFNV